MKKHYARIAVIGEMPPFAKDDITKHHGVPNGRIDLTLKDEVDAVVIISDGLAVQKALAEAAFSKGVPVFLYVLPAEGARGNNFPNTHKCGERTKSGAYILKVGNNWTDIGDGPVALMPC